LKDAKDPETVPFSPLRWSHPLKSREGKKRECSHIRNQLYYYCHSPPVKNTNFKVVFFSVVGKYGVYESLYNLTQTRNCKFA